MPTPSQTAKLYNVVNSCRESSAKYGPCEVCGKHVGEVFHGFQVSAEFDGIYAKNVSAFGHEDCILKTIKGERIDALAYGQLFKSTPSTVTQ